MQLVFGITVILILIACIVCLSAYGRFSSIIRSTIEKNQNIFKYTSDNINTENKKRLQNVIINDIKAFSPELNLTILEYFVRLEIFIRCQPLWFRVVISGFRMLRVPFILLAIFLIVIVVIWII